MEFIAQFFDIVLHLDVHLTDMAAQYGLWVYAILFAIIFAETGFVVTPFLPGDSLLFVAGALAALGGDAGLAIWPLVGALTLAAVLGNMVNYQIGRLLGPKVFQWPQSRIFNRDALIKTHAFYERHGGKTLVLSRFLPLFRTFAPFVAGIGSMPYPRFFLFNLMGGAGWVFALTFLGYWFGNLPWVKQNLTLLIVGIVVVSLLPVLVGYLKHRMSANAAPTLQADEGLNKPGESGAAQ
ncbi:membrane protein [Betaproteobacteria bacterium]|nr:membrane protein [Betaproteobacteria bacterium]